MAGNGYSLPPLDSPDESEAEEMSGQERTVLSGKRDTLNSHYLLSQMCIQYMSE